eukprot:PhF_6_TR17089/c0_g1_i1/m.26259/K11127/TEP1; telomerase protein component 1
MSKEDKETLIRLVCASMIKEPSFGGEDPRSTAIATAVVNISKESPEFVLKLSVYLREELGIRSTACFLFSLAAEQKLCRPYLKAYISHVALLPNDWLQIATMSRTIATKKNGGKGPRLNAAIRKALVARFEAFSSFHLAKYNKESTNKKKASAAKRKGEDSDAEDAEELPYTLKQMIRILHINKPVENVMCILGKKYPATSDEFTRCGLPGTFDTERAGKRMRLPVPETWETKLSAEGNLPEVWESLIEKRQVPYLASLRNLRNMILAGMDDEHHQMVMARLSDPTQVANSKLFPYRFFSAFEAININPDTCYEDDIAQRQKAAASRGAGGRGGRGGARGGRGRGGRGGRGGAPVRVKEIKQRFFPKCPPTHELLAQYKATLDTAVKIATKTNIKPIYGRSVVIVNVGPDTMEQVKAQGAKGISSVRTIRDVSVLLGLMFKYACEDCELILFNESQGYITVGQLQEESILGNMTSTLRACDAMAQSDYKFPFDKMDEWLKYKTHLDALIVIDTKQASYESKNKLHLGGVKDYVEKLRKMVNPDLLYVSVDVNGGSQVKEAEHPNDVLLTGFSDTILQFVGERGSGAQLKFIERIHETYKIDTRDVVPCDGDEDDSASDGDESQSDSGDNESATSEATSEASVKDLKEVRLFISSTFLDMRNEREVLVNKVLPALRTRLQNKGMDVVVTEIDLRWGITQEEAEKGTSLSLCLNEVQRCNYFIGMIGDRYGYCPPNFSIKPDPEFDPESFEWLQSAEVGTSVTHLEIKQALHMLDRGEMKGAFFYLRDQKAFLEEVPKDQRAKFVAENDQARTKVLELRKHLRRDAQARVYTPEFVPNNPKERDTTVKLALHEFESKVLSDLFLHIVQEFGGADASAASRTPEEWLDDSDIPHDRIEDGVKSMFAGRAKDVHVIQSHIKSGKTPILLVTGEEGIGKTALVAYSQNSINWNSVPIMTHYFAAGAHTADPLMALYRVALTLKIAFELGEEFAVKPDVETLSTAFPAILSEVGSVKRIVIVWDGLDQTSNPELTLQLLPVMTANVRNIKYIVTTRPGSAVYTSLNQRKPQPITHKVDDIPEESVRSAIIRNMLRKYAKKLEDRASQGNPLKNLAVKKDSGKPGYLEFALNYLRMNSSFDTLLEDVRNIPATFIQLLNFILEKCEKSFGKENVKELLGVIALSNVIGGIPECELPFVIKKSKTPAIRGIIQALNGNIITVKGGVVTGKNNAIVAALLKRYVNGASEAKALHANIATSLKQRKAFTAVGLKCLLHHTIAGGLYDAFEEIATDLEMIENLAQANLLASYVSAAAAFDNIPSVKRKLDPYVAFVVASSSVLSAHPNLTVQHARNATSKSIVSLTASKKALRRKWISWENKLRHSENMCKSTTRGASAPIMSLAFTSDNRVRVVGGKDWTARVYNQNNGRQTLQLRHPNDVRVVVIRPGNAQVATGCADGVVRVYGLVDGALIATSGNQHSRAINGLSFSVKGELLLSASDDTTVKMWDLEGGTNKLLRILNITDNDRPVTCVKVHKEGKYFATGSFDGRLLVYENVSCAATLFETLTAPGMRAIRDIAWIPSLVLNIAVASYDGCVRLFNVSGKELLVVLDGHFGRPVTSTLFSPDGKFMVSADFEGCVKLWRAGVVGEELGALLGHTGNVKALSYSSNGKQLVTGAADASLRTWEATDVAMESALLPPHSTEITSITFSPDGAWFVTTSRDGYARVTDRASNELKFFMKHQSEEENSTRLVPVLCSAVDKLGIRVYTGAVDGFIRIWNAFAGIGGNNGSLITKVKFQQSAVSGLFAVESTVFASSWDGTIVEFSDSTFELVDEQNFNEEGENSGNDSDGGWNSGNSDNGAQGGRGHEITCMAGSSTRSGIPFFGNTNKQYGSFAARGNLNTIDTDREDGNWITAIAVSEEQTVAVASLGKVHFENGSSFEVEDDFFQDGRPAYISGLAWVTGDTLAVASRDRSVRLIRADEGVIWTVVSWFHATAPLTSISSFTSHGVRYLCAGDALGNVYVLDYKDGDSVTVAHQITSASQAVGIKSDQASVSGTSQSGSQRSGQTGTESELDYYEESSYRTDTEDKYTDYDSEESVEKTAFELFFQHMPRGLSIMERKAFVKRQQQILANALKTYKTCEESRRIVTTYAQQQNEFVKMVASTM